MVIEILNGGEILVNCKFKLNKNLNLKLYHEILRNSNPIKISIRLCIVIYRDIWFSRFWLVDWNLPSIQDFDYHLIQHFESHLPRNGLYYLLFITLPFPWYYFLNPQINDQIQWARSSGPPPRAPQLEVAKVCRIDLSNNIRCSFCKEKWRCVIRFRTPKSS